MTPSITGRQSELGRILARQADAPDGVHFNLSGQQANTLLHDGHAWKDFARTARAGTRRAMRSEASLLVHASMAFVCAEPAKDPLRALAQAVLECEQMVLSGPTPAVVVRLGYLYGPTSADLRAYRAAFKIGRPYWAGPRGAGQFHLHHDDAVSALLKAAQQKHAGKTLYASAGAAVPFMRFMDHFARGLGTRCPLHVPRITAPLMQLIVRKEHMQQVALAMPTTPPRPQVPGWKPTVTDYRQGLDAVIEDWQAL